MESLNRKMQIIRSTHHNLLWGKFPIQEQTRRLRLHFSDFLTCESSISKHESSVLTESIKQCSQFGRKSWKGYFAHMHCVENPYISSCTVWRGLTRSHKSQMLFLLLTPCRYMTLDSFLCLVTRGLFGFLKVLENAVNCNLTMNFKQYLFLVMLYNSVH